MMRSIVFGFCLALIVVLFSQAALCQPAIEMDETKFDFGTSYPNQMLKHDFLFTNKGDQPLQVTKVSTTCGCAAAVLSSTTVLPSATSIVSVTVVTGSPRKKKESATLYTNDPDRPRVTLSVETDVRDLWVVTPKSSFLFTELPFESKHTMQLMLKNEDGKPFKVKAVSVQEPELSVDVGEPASDGVPVTLTVNSGKEKKIINDQVKILTDHPKQPMVGIQVFGRIVGYVRFNRQRVFFGTMKTGEMKKLEITAKLADGDTENLRILDIQSDEDAVAGKVLGMRGDGQLRVSLTYQAPMKPGYQTGNIVFKTNQEKEPVCELPYSALIRQ